MQLKSNAKFNVIKRTRVVYMLLCFIFLVCGIQQSRAGAFTASGSTLTLDLNVASQVVTVVSTGTTYTVTLSGGATNTWTGTTSANVTVSGAVLTITSAGRTVFGTINITDSQTDTGVSFATSGVNTYSDNFNITLDNTAGSVSFAGSSAFDGINALNVVTDGYISFPLASSLSSVNGNINLSANMQATPNAFLFSGIKVDAATVQITGTGQLTMSARGGVGVNTSHNNKGIAIVNGGLVKGGTTGTTTVEGRGYTGVAGTIEGQGVFVYSLFTAPTPSTITSFGSDVVVNGFGANSNASTYTDRMFNIGVVVGGSGSSAGTLGGTITSGGTGKVTINGTGGHVPNPLLPANSGWTNCAGVYVNGSNALITSGGAGLVTINGTADGSDSLGYYNIGVELSSGIISSGTNGSVVVTGRGHTGANDAFTWGVWVQGSSGKITTGLGTGTTNVTGYGGNGWSGSSSGDGIYVTSGGTITAGGSGDVNVFGYGGGIPAAGKPAPGNTHRGISLTSLGGITSNGGNVNVTATGGGYNCNNNYGISMATGGYITAGGNGNVTVTGNGGNNTGTSGTTNYGVVVSSGGSGQAEGYITSNGGNVTVNGTGGGGNSSSASASSSSTNYGVFLDQGGYITSGGLGAVIVTGIGGNTSPGSTGSSNWGVNVNAFSIKGTTGLYSTKITTGGGYLLINGTGGGGNSTSSITNYGVGILGLVKPMGKGTLTIAGSGGAGGGASNYGVYLNGAPTVLSVIYPATITSDSANVTVTGTGGGSGTSGTNYGVYANTGGIITAGVNGAVSVTGYGGNANGQQNYGVYVNAGTAPNFSTITSGGGSVTVSGTGPQAAGGSNQHGVVVSSAVIKSGGNANVAVTGSAGKGDVGTSGNGHIGVQLSGSTGLITSGGNGSVSITGNGAGDGARANNYGVQVNTGAIISSGGTGTVTVNGNGGTIATGATQYGVTLSGTNSKITSGGGNIIINATEGGSSTSYAIDVEASGGGITTATNGGDITLKGNSIKLATSAIATAAAGSLNIIPLTNNTEVQFTSATDIKGKVYLSSTELGLITADNINIGNANTGPISISQAVTVPSGSNLNLATASASAGLNPKLTGTEITMGAGKTLGLSGIPSLNIAIAGATVNTQYDQLKVVGDVTLTGMTLSLSGVYTPTGGNVFTIVDATSVTGTFTGLANGATVTFNGILLTINYTPTTVTLTAPCTNPTAGGTIAAAQSGYNPFNPADFTSSVAASGQFGTVEYKWQSSTTSNIADFIDIASSNAATYTASSLTVTTWFKRLARVSCKSDWTGAAESNVLEITVIACINPTDGGTIAAAQNGTTPFNPVAFTSTVAASGETGTIEYKWQSSTTSNNADFIDIASINTDTYDADALDVTTWFKRLARVSCKSDWTGAAETNVVEVTVISCSNPTAGGTISADQSGIAPFNPAAFTSSAAASGQTGTIEYKWQSSTTSNSADFIDIASINTETYDAGSLTQTTWFKRLARVSCSADWSGAAASNVLEVTIISLATQPIAQPTNLYFTNTGTSSPYNIVSNFTVSASAAGYIVVRKTGASPSFVPVDGTSYSTGAQGSDEIVYVGNTTSVTDYAATDAVSYHYAIYAYNGSAGATNYLSTNPLTGSAINKSSNTEAVANTSQSTSAGFPTAGVNVTFPNGTTGSTISANKTNSVPASNFSVLPGVRGVVNQYFTITSSNASPGTYTLILDFSSLGLTNSAWNSFKILKRANASAPWVNIIDLGATIANRQTDGVWGKFTITGLSSFSQFTGGGGSNTITVTSASETGVGTLKQAILDATAGDFIEFDTSAMGSKTITLTTPLLIDKDLTLLGAEGGITLDGNNATLVMEIADIKVVRLERLKIVNGSGNVGYAGGIWNKGNLTMVNCVVSGNKETGNLGVGGILQFSDTGDDPDDVLNLINCTVTANDGRSAFNDGIGGLSVANGTAFLYNTIVYGNTGDGFGDIDQTTAITEIYNSCIGNLTNVTYTTGTGNIATDPAFVGSTVDATHPYAITNTSPAADAGDNAYSFDATDIRGGAFGRKINKTDGTAGTIDMGAYEFSGCVNPTSGGVIAAAQSGVSPFNPAAFTSTSAATGQTGTLEYKWQSSTTSNSAGFSDIGSSNAETYDAGALTVTTWFKRLARVTCSANWTGAPESNVLEVSVSAINTWTGTTSNNFNTGTNWSLGTVPTSAETFTITSGNPNLDTNFTVSGSMAILGTGSLTINPGKTLTISGTADFGGNLVTIKSDATGTGSIGQITGTLTGASNVTVERFIPNNGFRSWRLLSVPTYGTQTINGAWQEGNTPMGNNTPGYGTQVTGTTTSLGFDDVSIYPGMLYFNGNNFVGIPRTSIPISTNKAYFLYTRGDRTVGVSSSTVTNTATTLRTNGTLYQGTQTSELFPASSYALIGNPFASAINFNALTRTGGVKNAYYLWDSKIQSGNTLGTYQTFSATNGFNCLISGGSFTLNAANTTIQSGQAFFVETDFTAGSVIIPESSKVASSGNTGYKLSGELVKIDSRLYSIASTGTTMADANVVVFDSAYSNAVDGDDASKFSNTGENLAILRNAASLVIEGRNPVNVADTIFFKMWNMKPQAYQLEFVPQNLGTQNLTARLEDSYLNTSTPVDLTGNTLVGFTVNAAPASFASNRFRIVFAQAVVLPVSFQSISASRKASNAVVNWKVSNEINIRSYEVERSSNGSKYDVVGTVTANAASAYSFTDLNVPSSNLFYRVKSIGAAGDVKYSTVVKLGAESIKPSFAIVPNPVEVAVMNIQFGNQPKGMYQLRLVNAAGQQVTSIAVTHPGGFSTHTVNIPSAMAKGTYQLEISAPDKTISVQKVMVISTY